MQATAREQGEGSGTFGLLLEAARTQELQVGSLGSLRFPEGVYAYAGEARQGLPDRVDRLVAAETRARRHVDRVLPELEAREAVTFEGEPGACALALHLARHPASLPVIGFGATGCTCLTHLHGFLEADAETVRETIEAWTGSEARLQGKA